VLAAGRLLLCAVVLPAAPPTVKEFSLTDAAGKKHSRDEWKGKKAVVLFFLSRQQPAERWPLGAGAKGGHSPCLPSSRSSPVTVVLTSHLGTGP
jgi:hypothetical protein